MSERESEQVRILREGVDTLNRRDLEALRRIATPDMEFRSRIASMEGRVYEGYAGMEQYLADVDAAFGRFAWQIDDIEEKGNALVSD